MASKKKFQVGDIVKIRQGDMHWVSRMHGVKCEVVGVYSNGNVNIKLLQPVDLRPYEDKTLQPGYTWLDEMPRHFDLVSHASGCRFESLL